MKQRKLPLLLVVALSCVLYQPAARAATFLTEQFVGYADGRLGDTATGGGGVSPGWFTPQDAITLTNAKPSLVGTNFGLVSSAGTRVSIAAVNLATPLTAGGGSYNRIMATTGWFPPTVETNLYSSFLYLIHDISEVSPDGQFISAMNRQNSGWNNSGTQNTFAWFLVARSAGGFIQLGLTRWDTTTGTYAETNYASVNLSAGTNFFVVIRQHIIPPAATPDQIDLWINPAASSFGTNDANIPPSDASHNAGTDDTSGTGPGRLWVVASGAAAEIDEIRFANTWAEVTPPIGQCVAAEIVSSPASVTQVEGINATFSVDANGTAATYQWQLSTNSGSTWNDIDGAILSDYTTPNLWQATDNGNQYRAIVSVLCDGSSATSSVATVTLTNAIFTPEGVVMDDTFLDPELGFDSRQNTPLTASNSLWYTWVPGETDEPTSLLNAFGQGGNMVGTPRTGTSSLWLGYFIGDSNVVSLDIGKALKVTLPFTPTSYGARTGNGALRFGLFDYHDASTVVTADASDLTGSGGRAARVRGYMLSVDFGPTFTANSPLSLLVRSGISDPNLMGTTGNYTSMGSGPAGGGYSNAPAFQPGVEYTLEFTVLRTGQNSANVTANITGGGTNWMFSATDTNFGYYRFDTFAVRPNSLETSADSFVFSEFKAEVETVTLVPASINITSVSRTGNSVTLNWNATPAASYTYSVRRKTSLDDLNWTTIQSGITTTTFTDTTATADTGFYSITSP